MADRQTRTTVMLGGVRGVLTWRNGPATWTPDGGDPVPVQVSDGGASSGPPPRSWDVVRFADGRRVEADRIEESDRHDRWYSPIFGDGWLVMEDGEGWWQRFEDDDGNVKVRFETRAVCVGRPDYARKMERSSRRMPPIDDPDEMNWSTWTARDGTTMAMRRGGPPPPAGTYEPVRSDTLALFTKKARAAYDAAMRGQSEVVRGGQQMALLPGGNRG